MTITEGLARKIPTVVRRLNIVVAGTAIGMAAIALVVGFGNGVFIALPVVVPFLLIGSGRLSLVPWRKHLEQLIWKRTLGLSIWAGILLSLVILGAVVYASFDTRYAAGYSEEAFQSIRVGDTKEEVMERLGERLLVWSIDGGVLRYSGSPSGSSYLIREIVVDSTKSRVIEIRRDIWWD